MNQAPGRCFPCGLHRAGLTYSDPRRSPRSLSFPSFARRRIRRLAWSGVTEHSSAASVRVTWPWASTYCSPDGGRARCHGLAASPVSSLPGQAGSSHPPVAYRVARLPVPLVRRHRTRNGAGKPVTGLRRSSGRRTSRTRPQQMHSVSWPNASSFVFTRHGVIGRDSRGPTALGGRRGL